MFNFLIVSNLDIQDPRWYIVKPNQADYGELQYSMNLRILPCYLCHISLAQ